MDANMLMLSILFGSIGSGMLIYGKKQMALVPAAAGVALLVVPYVLPGPVSLLVVGLGLTALPFLL